MKSITELKNPDIIEVNGEKYQVLDIEDGLYNEKKDDIEWIVNLVKVGEKSISPNYSLTFMGKEPKKIKFFINNPKTKEEKEEKVKSLKF
ncbi:MAG: hypothetical protein RL557_211 [archaeon]|jgi:hypothetical protein